jgi:5-methylcytosine-specific restriction enzyme subunit McrC
LTIRVPESGSTYASPEIAASVSADPALWRLVEAGYLRVEPQLNGGMRIFASTLVGQVNVADTTLEIFEKIPGETAVLLSHASLGAFRIEEEKRSVTPPGPLVGLLVHEYLKRLRRYASEGRESGYRTRRETGSLIGGRLRPVETIGLRARGLGHLAAFDRSELRHDTDLNRVLYRALRRISAIARFTPLLHGDISLSRALGLVFEDCFDRRFLAMSDENALRTAGQLRGVRPSHQDVLELATLILANVSLDPGSQLAASSPRSWFIDLGVLFEATITNLLGEVVGAQYSVEEGSVRRPPIFDGQRHRYRADPDLVVRSAAMTVAIGDVKHKAWLAAADEADMYQLLVHTAAYQGAHSFLIYPNTEYEALHLGRSAVGSDTWLFAVDVGDLRMSVASVAKVLGIAPKVAAA